MPRGQYYRHYYSGYEDRFQRDLRIAFYRNDVKELNSLTPRMSVAFIGDDDSLGVLTPFDIDIFTKLDPILQQAADSRAYEPVRQQVAFQ